MKRASILHVGQHGVPCNRSRAFLVEFRVLERDTLCSSSAQSHIQIRSLDGPLLRMLRMCQGVISGVNTQQSHQHSSSNEYDNTDGDTDD